MLSAALLVAGCGDADAPPEAEASETTSVAAAFYPLAFAAERVGGRGVDVRNLTPPGAEPHDVELSARDVERIRAAGVVLYLGGGFQPALERAVAGADGTTVDLLEAVELLPLSHGHAHGEEEAEATLDPHVWLDPLRYAAIVREIGIVLDARSRAEELAAELRGLDREFREGLADCARREIVTSHAAFGYLADRYELEQIAIAGLSPEAEPSARDLERIVEEVREHRATTVFAETLVSPRVAETVAREAGARTAVLNPLEGLTADERARGDDYFDVMRANLETLREALGCR
ncbi:MAG TPA: zinc ABC transporter substrate-binding protein [Gaiellaceae bacterium]|nr:zinc ABC transporter substrate-binding protein [Gaiellaceae bacterium]